VVGEVVGAEVVGAEVMGEPVGVALVGAALVGAALVGAPVAKVGATVVGELVGEVVPSIDWGGIETSTIIVTRTPTAIVDTDPIVYIDVLEAMVFTFILPS